MYHCQRPSDVQGVLFLHNELVILYTAKIAYTETKTDYFRTAIKY